MIGLLRWGKLASEDWRMMRLRILVPLDGSVQARRALVYARELAQGTGGRLLLVHSAPGGPVDFIERRLDRIARRVEASGVATEWRIIDGQPARAIHEAATSWGADL